MCFGDQVVHWVYMCCIIADMKELAMMCIKSVSVHGRFTRKCCCNYVYFNRPGLVLKLSVFAGINEPVRQLRERVELGTTPLINYCI